ncbi:MAG: SDH family Clp fold serine proteinase [Alphaproteobacteria bacterium]
MNGDAHDEEEISEMTMTARSLARLRGRPCLVLAREEIERWDVRLLIEQVARWQPREAIDVLLCTNGGSIDGAYRILREIRRRYRTVTLFVPAFAKSAGTLFALGADEIVMGPLGEFGPMDAVNALAMSAPLGRDGSSLLPGIAIEVLRNSATEWVRDAAEAVAVVTGGGPRDTMGHAIDLVTKLTAPVLAQVTPETLAASTRQTNLGRHYGGRVSERYRGHLRRSVTKRQVERLVVGYPSHGFVIDYEELVEMELPVRPAEGREHDLLMSLGLFLVRPPVGCPDEISYVPATGDERVDAAEEGDDGEDDGPETHAAGGDGDASTEESVDADAGGDEAADQASAPEASSRREPTSSRRRRHETATQQAPS